MLVTVFSLFLHKGIISPAFVEFVDMLRLSDSVQRIGHKLQCIFVAIRIDNILGTVHISTWRKNPKTAVTTIIVVCTCGTTYLECYSDGTYKPESLTHCI